ncbi:TRAP transporter substrate-binding protein DctP [Pokkaliibacter sp. MBI-7]|uniref:TRAP transporter substrate-binding protein n=1 Tax=Pokkaliibacter sp. MBI-7 TaxID=3040600 RepID=UPI0024488F6F|nr:TRAP transporter substrate-binding protein DctP [Pokkaliibacter sp. MBI-7]MDH2433822.1 TRAP transporter substrate-binding protein DctP [Pokkaliibacter sp. MBI-7]
MPKHSTLKPVAAAVKTLALAGLLGGAALNPLAASAADFTFNLVHLSNTDDEDYDGALVFKDYVESHSNGRIAVQLYPGGQLCGAPVECIESLQSNLIQIFQATTGGVSNVFPEIQALDVPYMFPSDRVAECALGGPLVGELREEVLKRTGSMRLMTIGNTGGWRNFATVSKQIKSPADVKGMKIRTINSPIQMELVKNMGGTPTPIGWSEVYTSLATGVIEGTKNGITDIMSAKLNEHIKYITLDGHGYMGSMWWMNQEAFAELPDDLKQVVDDGFDALRWTTIVMPKRRQIEAYEAFKKGGGTVYTPSEQEKAEFVKAAEPIHKWFSDQYGSKWLDTVQNAVNSCEASLKPAG